MKPHYLIVVFLGLWAGCGSDASATTLTVSELLSDRALHEGERIRVLIESGQVALSAGFTAAACLSTSGPCNNAVASYRLEGSSGFVELVPADDYAPQVTAFGYTPLNSPNFADKPVRLGCHGNDAMMVCAPAVPAALLTVEGRFERTSSEDRIVVDAVEFDASVTVDIDEQFSIQLENASLYEEAPEGCVFQCELMPREE